MSNEKTLDMSRFPENLDVSQNYGDKYLELRSSVLEVGCSQFAFSCLFDVYLSITFSVPAGKLASVCKRQAAAM